MKTIILYATKHGAAQEIAQKIADKFDGSIIHNLKQSFPSLSDFDCIILGSSVYAGSIRSEAKAFLRKNENILLEKSFGIFLCGIGKDGEKSYLDSNFSEALLSKAKAKSFLGGIFDPKKANGFERFIIKIVTKSSGYINIIDEKMINQFADAMKT